MTYFSHRFEALITAHPVGRYFFTVVYLPEDVARELPFEHSARLRVEADVSGVPVKGAWQPSAQGRYLMLPKAALKAAGLGVGSPVEVAFRLLPQDDVDIPPELADLLARHAQAAKAWAATSAGKQRGFAHMVASAKRPQTRLARVEQVRAVLLGEAPEPWRRK